MTIRTWLLFLIGDRQAILTLASDRRALWVGLLFVLSAGFAREYDARSLLDEPGFYLLPLLASLIASLILFIFLFPARLTPTDAGNPRPRFFFGYARFLTLFWMTSPLAWLYSIPFERFLSSDSAALANMVTLAVVAAWRVVLMVRVVSELMGYRTVSAFFRVMLYADLIALVGGVVTNVLTHGPLILMMGGIRHPVTNPTTAAIGSWVGSAAIVLIPVWFLGLCLTVPKNNEVWRGPLTSADLSTSGAKGMWLLAFGSLAVWVVILPWTQPPQLLRCQVESDLRAGRIVQALDTMSAHEPGDFPPFWEPPVVVSGLHFKPHILDVMDAVVEKPPAPWVRARFLSKFDDFLDYYGINRVRKDDAMDAAQYLLKLPEGEALAAAHQERIRETMKYAEMSPEDKARLEALFNRATGSEP